MLLTAASMTLAGCGLFPKNSGGSAAAAPDRLPPAAVSTSRQAVIAGQVVDTFHQRRGGVQLTLQPVEGGETTTAITNSEGYFTVTSLQSGKRYRITARSQQGAVLSTGSAEATAPNAVVLIKLNDSRTEVDGKSAGMSGSVGGKHSSIAGSDDFSPAWSRGNPAETGRGDRLGAAPDVASPPPANGASSVNNASTPSAGGIKPRLGPPVTTEPPGTGNVPTRPEYIADTGARIKPPVMNIAGPNGHYDGEGTPASRRDNQSIQFFDHPLSDLDGRPARLADYRGRLTLIDLWNTNCIPCIQAMPELMRLQKQYRHQGFVVVGIAVNEQGSQEARAAKIRWRTNPKGIDYPLLMEANLSTSEAFQATEVPTLILLDERGRELWRGVGFNPTVQAQLEKELAQRLR